MPELQAQPGAVDLTFDPGAGPNASVNAMALQPDGKLLIGGGFTRVNGVNRSRIARLNEDGSLDQTFDAGTVANHSVYAVVVQPDGKVLIGGAFTDVGGVWTWRSLARLFPDGSLDSNFVASASAVSGRGAMVSALTLQGDGRIVVGLAGENPETGNYVSGSFGMLWRLNADGSYDFTYSPYGYDWPSGGHPQARARALAVQGDGRLLLAHDSALLRFLSNGYTDLNFLQPHLTNVFFRAVAAQPDGRILVSGSFTNLDGHARDGLARLLADGNVDSSFDPGSGWGGKVNCVVVQNDGRLVIGGGFTNVQEVLRPRIARLHADGRLDSSFDPGSGASGEVRALSQRRNGRIVLGGSFTSVGGAPRANIVQLLGDPSAPPEVTTQPASQNITLEQDATFFVHVSGQPSPEFQWRLSEVDIPGATRQMFTITNAQFSDAGDYTVVVSNTLGCVTSTVATLTVQAAPATPGWLDVAFAPRFGANGSVEAVAVQPDGKLVIGGEFTEVNGVGRNRIARLNADGRLDTSFDPGSGAEGWWDGATTMVLALVVQPDGRILIGGGFTNFNGVPRNSLARLNPDGTLDTTFGASPTAHLNVRALAMQSDGKVLVGGWSLSGTASYVRLTRLNADGTIDAGYSPMSEPTLNSVFGLALQPDGRFWVGGRSGARGFLSRLLPNGDPDDSIPTVNVDRAVQAIALQPDGGLVFGGSFTNVNGLPRSRIARLRPDGSLDPIFGLSVGADNMVSALLADTCGRVLIAGAFTTLGGVRSMGLARLNADGTLDTGFEVGDALNGQVTALALQRDGDVMVGGWFTSAHGGTRQHLVSLIGDSPAMPVLLVQPSNQVVTVGESVTLTAVAACPPIPYYQWRSNGVDLVGATNATLTFSYARPAHAAEYTVVVRNPSGAVTSAVATLTIENLPTMPGALDIEFYPPPTNVLTHAVRALALQPDGAIVAATDWRDRPQDRYLHRFSPDGSWDSGFAAELANTPILAVAQQRDGRILATTVNALLRLDPDGSLDRSYSVNVCCTEVVAVQEDSHVVIGGGFSSVNGHPAPHLARLDSDGRFDDSFAIGTGPNSVVSFLASQHDGAIVIGSQWMTQVDGRPRVKLARLLPNGHLDESFNPVEAANALPNALAVQPDGKVLVGGPFSIGTARHALIRLHTSGALDTNFNPGFSAGDTVHAIAVQADGRLLVGGTFTQVGGLSRNRIVRLNPDGSVDATFDPGSGVTGLSPVAVYAIAEESHTGIFLGGLFTDYNGLPRLNLVRVHGNPVILQPTRSADSFQVRVQTDRGRTYTLETKDPLDAGAWVPLSNVPGNGSPQTLTDTNASALRRFYRVRVE